MLVLVLGLVLGLGLGLGLEFDIPRRSAPSSLADTIRTLARTLSEVCVSKVKDLRLGLEG